MAAKKKTDSTVRCFEVGEPRLHEKGYTIYKVTLKTINIEAPEDDVVETVLWKRYNDFKKLYKVMSTLHKALHRAGEFPPFARAKVFGRFDDQVILERQQSGQDLLNFVAQRSYLVKSKAFKEFCEGGQLIKVNPHSDPILEPLRLDQEDNVSISSDTDLSSVASSSADLTGQEIPHPTTEPMDRIRDEVCQDLGGVWQFRQAVDNISLDDEELGETEMGAGTGGEAGLSADVDLSIFDPIHTGVGSGTGACVGAADQGPPVPGDTFSNLWLLSALSEFNVEAGSSVPLSASEDSGSQGAVDSDQGESDAMGRAGSKFDKRTDGVGSENALLRSVQTAGSKGKSMGDIVDLSILNLPSELPTSSDLDEASSSLSSPKKIAEEFDPLKPTKKVTCGHGDAGFSLTDSLSSKGGNQSDNVDSTTTDRADNALVQAMKDGGKPGLLSGSSSPSRSPRRQFLPVELGEKGKYIVTAARQISLAQQCEANGNYHMAFTYYKNSVGVLLTGVQGDDNAGRREVVRRKTARYLMKAEDIYNKYLVSKGSVDDNRWDTGQSTRQELTQELDPHVALLQGPVSELSNYRVLGVIDSVLLTLDKTTNSTFIMKVLHKSSIKRHMANLVPTNCPYMVKLHKFYETENAIYLLLQHATGGKLWVYVSGFLNQQQEHLLDEVFARDGLDGSSRTNVYSGQCLHEPNNKKSPPNSVNSPNHGKNNSNNKLSTPRRGPSQLPRSHEEQDIAGLLKKSEGELQRLITPVMDMAERGEGEGSSEPDVETGESKSSYVKLLMEGQDIKDDENVAGKEKKSESRLEKKAELISRSLSDEPMKDVRRYSDFLGLEDSQDSPAFNRSVSGTHPKSVSLTSDDRSEDPLGSAKSPGMDNNERFAELLRNSSKPSLENFSINSFDSDSAPCSRFDSTASDYIESIPEVNENSPKHGDKLVVGPSPSSEEVFLTIGESNSDLVIHKPINRHLQNVITEESPVPKIAPLKIEPASDDDEGGSSVVGLNKVGPCVGVGKNVIDSPPEMLVHHDPILGLDVSSKGPDSSSFTGSFEEPSIYDIHRHTDTDSGSINLSIDEQRKPVLPDPTSPTEIENRPQSLTQLGHDLKDKPDALSKPDEKHYEEVTQSSEVVRTSPSKETAKKSVSKKGGSGSTSPTKRSSRPPLNRIHSGERSLETDIRRSRKRTLSGVFGELDLADEDGEREAVHLPEGCIRQWAAEMVTAIASLHKLGIICRDLRPANILLGDRGHILLTYHCRWNCVVEDVNPTAISNLYCAPEVSGIFDMTPACDWWSLGVILFELLTGKSLVSCYPGGITSHTSLVIPDHVSPEAQSLLYELLRYNSSERLGSGINGADDVKHHPFFSDITWSDLQG